MPSKRERGKQRKAAKQQTITATAIGSGGRVGNKMLRLSPKKLLAQFKKGCRCCIRVSE